MLAGPILRLVDRRQVTVWLATRVDRALQVEVYRAVRNRLERLAAAPTRSARIGERLWAHVAAVRSAGSSGFLSVTSWPTTSCSRAGTGNGGWPTSVRSMARRP